MSKSIRIYPQKARSVILIGLFGEEIESSTPHTITFNSLIDLELCYIYIVIMNGLSFEWDENKNEQNQKRHGVAFEEAQTVFFDDNAVEFYDAEHSEHEDRFLILGFSARFRMLIICHCFREDEDIIRIISARKATKNERKFYPRR